MNKPEINQKIIDSLGLSENEAKVFDVLCNQPMGDCVAGIGCKAGLPRTTVIYILRRLKERKLAEEVLFGKRIRWKYKRGLEFLERKPMDMGKFNSFDD